MAARDSDDLFDSGEASPAFDIGAYLATLRKFWWIVAVCLGGGLVIGLVLLRMSKPEYISTAEMKIERRAPSSAISLSGSQPDSTTTPEDLKTIERSFASPAVMRRVTKVIRSEGFEELRFDGHAASDLSDGSIQGYLQKGCEVALIPSTRLMQVSFRNENPAMSQKLANLIINEGIQNDLDQRIAATGSNIRYLQDEVAKFEENLRKSEEKLNAYTRTLGNVSIDGDMNIVANELRELNARATAAKAERLRLESDYSQVQGAVGDPARLMKIDSIQKLPAIVSLSAQIADVETKIAKLALRYRDESPFMEQARSELAELNDALRREVLTAPRQIESALATATRNEEAIKKEQALQEEKVIQLRDLSVPSGVFQRQIDANRVAYEAALRRLSEELSQARNQPVLLQVTNPAGYGYPAGSRSTKMLGIALFVGALLGFGGIFLITQLDASIRTVDDAEKSLGLGVLGAIPEHTLREDAPPPQSAFEAACPALSDRSSVAAEALRSLRLALRFEGDTSPGRAILVCGSAEGEGSSFCASNLAIVFAQAGHRTLLVDANLRTPSLERTIFASRGKQGLAELLHREAGLASVIHPTRVPLFDVVPAGRPSAFPAESLSHQRFAEFLAEARPLYDRIVVDAAPLGKVSDTLAIAPLFPAICFLVRAASTPRPLAKKNLEALRRAGATPLGIVLNFAPGDSTLVNRAEEDPFAFAPGEKSVCPGCGTLFESRSALISRTSAVSSSASKEVRRCTCGAEISLLRSDERDTSEAGAYRRRIFGELLGELERSGLGKDSARDLLLLTLKIWRHEAPPPLGAQPTGADAERVRLFTGVLDCLTAAGFTPAEARKKLIDAMDAWRAKSQ